MEISKIVKPTNTVVSGRCAGCSLHIESGRADADRCCCPGHFRAAGPRVSGIAGSSLG